MADRYTRQQIALHWVIFALVALQYLLHDPISDAFDVIEDGGAARITALVGLHIGGGVLIFALMLVRLSLRLTHGAPPPPDVEPAPLRKLSHAAHWVFYALLILLPVSGAIAWFRQNETAAEAHEVMRALLLGLIVLHLAGVAVHQFVWKSDILSRMGRQG